MENRNRPVTHFRDCVLIQDTQQWKQWLFKAKQTDMSQIINWEESDSCQGI